MEEKADTKQKRKSLWKRVSKWVLWTCACLILLIVLLLGAVVWFLTPERLTPIAEKYANEYLNANVEVGRVELTFWKTFPKLRVDVDRVSITSDGFAHLPEQHHATLPQNADTLLSLNHFHGGVNIVSLLAGKIEIYDVELRQPMINLVQYDDSTSNFDIIPPSTPDSTATSSGTIPDLSIDRFAIVDARPFTYTSVKDSISVGVTLSTTYLDGNNAPKYEIAFNGDAKALLPPSIIEPDVPVGINGHVSWSPSTPYAITLNDFTIDIAELHSLINAEIDMSDTLTLNSMDFSVKQLPIDAMISHIPESYRTALPKLNTDLTINFGVKLTKPYTISEKSLPTFDLAIDVPTGNLQFGQQHKPLSIATNIEANIIGENLNASTITLNRLKINGVSIDISLNGTVSSILRDPLIKANFDGSLYFNNLPPIVLKQLPGEIHGRLSANTSMNMRLSHLKPKSFHKAKITGQATLYDFTYIDSVTDFYTKETTFRFGSSDNFVKDNHRVDSLLTASIKIDTARVIYDGTRLTLSQLKAGVGCKNIASSSDSTQINPIGATIKAARVNLRTDDSTRVRLRNISCNASLRRFNQDAKVPELNLLIEAQRMNYGDNLNRLNLREGNINITAHIKKRREMSPKMKARYDSIAQLHPDLSSDSILKMIRPKRRSRQALATNSDREMLDFAVDSSTKDLLRRWNVHGTITAKRGRMFTPYFPLRNTLKNVNIDFTTDSLVLNNINYTVGKSDFLISGSVRNISRALTSRRGAPLYIDFSVRSDTIDVNQLAEAVFAGAAFADKSKDTAIDLTNIEDDDSIQSAIEQMQDTSQIAAVLLPSNIEATIRLRAHNVIYADMLLKRMRGIVMMRDGALNMHNLTASTDIGTVSLSALYTAPTKKELQFGFGLQIKDLQLNKFINMIPAVDSLMPMLKNFEGIIDADIAATTDIDSAMNIVMPSLNAAIKLHGDSLVLLDADTFKSLSKWLMFKNKKRNMIDNMTVEILVENSMLELFPFMFDIDRYRLGVMGNNDMAFNFNYHVSVLKSPLPFKFGLTVSGNADDMKIRVGKAKFKEKMVGERVAIVDTTRINLLNQIENVFRRGVKLGKLDVDRSSMQQGIDSFDIQNDTISHADSLMLIKEGILPSPPVVTTEDNNKNDKK